MMYELKNLWDGSINPSERFIREDSEYKEKSRQLCAVSLSIDKELSPTGKENFEAYKDLHADLRRIDEEESFVIGFRLGVRLLLDALSDYSGQFTYPG